MTEILAAQSPCRTAPSRSRRRAELRAIFAWWSAGLAAILPVPGCPTDALEKRPDGSVVFHKDRCIGCVEFCPHGVLTLGDVSAIGG
jgi:hypothetical protein